MAGPGMTDEQSRAQADAAVASLTTPDAIADPYPGYSQLRALSPVHRSGPALVFLSRYDDCAAVTRSPAFPSPSPAWADSALPGLRGVPGSVPSCRNTRY